MSALLRAAAVAALYAALRVLADVVLAAGSGVTVDVAGRTPVELASGALVAATLAPVARVLPGATPARALALAAAVFFNVAAVMIEGSAYAPDQVPLATLPLALLAQAGVAAALGASLAALFSAGTEEAPPTERHGPGWWAIRYAGCALVYVLLYLVTGAVNYALVTGPYYETHAGGLTVPPIGVVLTVAAFEGLLMPVAVLPMLLLLPGSRRYRALAAGAILTVLGGVVPLVQASTLPSVIRIASAVEIFAQKFPTGAAVALLLDTRSKRGPSRAERAAQPSRP